MRVRAMVFSARLLTAGMIASGAALAPVTDASAAKVIVRQQPRPVAVQAVSRPMAAS